MASGTRPLPTAARDFVGRAVFTRNHEIAAEGLQLWDEFRATHEIDCLDSPGLSRWR